jgi:hypothetical protein
MAHDDVLFPLRPLNLQDIERQRKMLAETQEAIRQARQLIEESRKRIRRLDTPKPEVSAGR